MQEKTARSFQAGALYAARLTGSAINQIPLSRLLSPCLSPGFYSSLAARGIVIYPGKLTHANCFRVGSIGRMFEPDMQRCVDAIRDVLKEMGVSTPVKQIVASE